MLKLDKKNGKLGDRIVYLVDPILRGSRLQLTYFFLASIQAQVDRVVLFTRSDYCTEHFDELIGDRFQMLTVISCDFDLDGEWIRSLNRREMGNLIDKMDLASSRLPPDVNLTIFFEALDDYFISLFLLRNSLRRIRCDRIIFLRYRTEFLLTRGSSIGQSLKFLSQKFILNRICRPNDLLLVMDERLCALSDSKIDCPISFLPEPWEGEFGRVGSAECKRELGIDADEFVFLMIGKQNRRKGLTEVLSALIEKPELLGAATFLIIGKIQSDIQGEVSNLVAQLASKRLIFDEKFVPEMELPTCFGASDCVLLPYTRDFQFTSGVLTRATASKVPVIASDHGVVGHRIMRDALGLVYPSGNPLALASRLSEMISASAEIKRNLRLRAPTSVEEGHIDKFAVRFRELMFGGRLQT